MHSIEKNELAKAASLLAQAYMEDPKLAVEMEGVDNKQELLEVQAKWELDELFGKGEIWLLDGEKGILTAYHSKRMSFMHYLKMIRFAANTVSRMAGKENLKKIVKNGKKLKKITDLGWPEKLSKTEPYYRLLNVYVAPSHRGKGRGRELLEPLLEFCDQHKLKIAADTVIPEGAEFLKHFGFEELKVLSDSKVDVKTCCMVRKPQAIE